ALDQVLAARDARRRAFERRGIEGSRPAHDFSGLGGSALRQRKRGDGYEKNAAQQEPDSRAHGRSPIFPADILRLRATTRSGGDRGVLQRGGIAFNRTSCTP